jgi:hypothetical protein
MIYINPLSEKIIAASNIHFEKLSKLLVSRINKNKRNFTEPQNRFMENEVIPNIKKILIGKPKEILKLSKIVSKEVENTRALEIIFNYEDWFVDITKKRYSAYDLANNLDINTCVYCNRNYTSTVKKITRPQFDHYFPQNTHPLLVLSFFNLIPSCSICNSNIKGRSEMELSRHLHPYLNNNLKDIKFSYEYNIEMKDSLKIKLIPSKNKKVNNTLKFFKTVDIYNAHTDELRDLIKMRDTFSDRYLQILSEHVLKDTDIGKDELYQFAFGVYKDEDKLSLRPFSKFKKDILTELGII